MRDQPTILYHLLSNPQDQIPQLSQKILNLIIQAVNLMVAKALDQKFGLDYQRPVIAFDDYVSNDT